MGLEDGLEAGLLGAQSPDLVTQLLGPSLRLSLPRFHPAVTAAIWMVLYSVEDDYAWYQSYMLR